MDNEPNDDLESWLAEPFTHRTREQIAKEILPDALGRLLHASRKSTDAAVRAAIENYDAATALQRLFTKGSTSP